MQEDNNIFGDVNIEDTFGQEDLDFLSSLPGGNDETPAEDENKGDENKEKEGKEAPLAPKKPDIIVNHDEEEFARNLNITGLENEENEDKEKDTPASEEDENREDDNKDEGVDYFKAVGEGLYKLGKFGEVPADIKWGEDTFLEQFDKLTDKGAENKVRDMITDKYGEHGMEMFNDIFVKGVDVKTYLQRYAEAEDYASLDMERENVQKYVIETYLRSMDPTISADDVTDQIEFLVEKGKLEEKAASYQKLLVKEQADEMRRMADEAANRQKVIKQKEKETIESIRSTVVEAISKKEINGIPLSVKDSTTLLPYMTEKAYELPNGRHITEFEKDLFYELRKDPTKWVALAKLVKDGMNVAPVENKGSDKAKEDIFNFGKNKNKGAKPSKGGSLFNILKDL